MNLRSSGTPAALAISTLLCTLQVGCTGQLAGDATDPEVGSGATSTSSTGGAPTTASGGAPPMGTGGMPTGGVGGTPASGSGGGSGATTGTGGMNDPGDYIFPAGRGPKVTFVTYEAEDMATNGSMLGPSRTFTEVASEASGRRAVRLSSQGQYVEFKNESPSNSIVVRYSIPDNGPDYFTKLSVFVNGELRTRLDVTSRYSWTYGGDEDFNQPWQNDPGLGTPHHFFDETRALVGDIPVGATVTIKRDSGDAAAYYDIDLVEMEQVPPPLSKPDGFLALTDCGATANDASDDSDAIQSCVDRVRGGEALGVFIPEGVFRSNSKTISVSGVTIRGAGMWHSTIMGFYARFDCWGTGHCKYYDFSVFGDTTQRIDDSPESAFGGNGTGGVVENVWIEHLKLGYWTSPGTDGLVIRSCRMRNLHADGVNFYGGTVNSIVENTHVRNTGDDALAAWSHAADGKAPNQNNIFRNNYVQIPWKANCFGVYGGNDTKIEHNVCADVVQYPGILLARQFDAHAFGGMTRIEHNSLIRAGGFAYGQPQGAIKLHAEQGPIDNVSVTDLDIVEPYHSGIHIQGEDFVGSTWFEQVKIINPGAAAVFLNWGSKGAMDAAAVVATGAPTGVINDADGAFTIFRGDGNSGW